MSLSALSRVLLEFAGCSPNEVPVYRNDVVLMAEQSIRSAKQDIRALLNFHQDAIESAKHQLQAAAAGQLDAAAANGKTLKELCQNYQLLTSNPDVALAIELSRFQQLRRGLNIYHAERITRLKQILLNRLVEQRALYPGTPAGPDSIPTDLLEKCSPAETDFLRSLTRWLQETGYIDSINNYSNACRETAVGRLRPPVWLATMAGNPETIPEVSLPNWAENPPDWRFGDLTVGRAGELPRP